MISIEPEVDIDPNDSTATYTSYFYFGIGATDRLDVNFKYGTTTNTKPYYGLHLEYHFIKENVINFAASFGGHYRNGVLLDLTPVISHKFEKCTVATGPEYNWKITKDKKSMLDWFVGTSFPMPHSMELSLNLGFPILNDTYWFSTGLSYYF